MPDHDWQQFERCALKLDELYHQQRLAEAAENHPLAQTIGWRIKSAESRRDRLLCRVSHARSIAA
ncbi:MAG TPA: hypothetical protein VHU15_09350 [Stellaceae bacterium]|jgi:hypothetical protein|nr:hypothetical protein [Stellaceae bacterium]